MRRAVLVLLILASLGCGSTRAVVQAPAGPLLSKVEPRAMLLLSKVEPRATLLLSKVEPRATLLLSKVEPRATLLLSTGVAQSGVAVAPRSFSSKCLATTYTSR